MAWQSPAWLLASAIHVSASRAGSIAWNQWSPSPAAAKFRFLNM
ncbi:hypothetical protein ACCUM_3494 [Candidatus Accumulibacter phosphatis]|uniref:Uncharacterized protein n=1 Tax=Candidatus Accumulibacter phosphatis TaxID=327160 RepID=A0A5S4EP07_9PROT|nr:hypothetical protein ACCUM_3494 [Candidatus Accumulibacter phosphatis]